MTGGADAVARLSSDQRVLIVNIADAITRNGPEFESWLQTRRKDNRKYSFLFKSDKNEHVFFEWCKTQAAAGVSSDDVVKKAQLHSDKLHREAEERGEKIEVDETPEDSEEEEKK